MEDPAIQGKTVGSIGTSVIDSSDDVCKALLLHDKSKVCVFKREDSFEVVSVDNDEEGYSIDVPVRPGNYCYKTYPHCRLCCGCSDYEHVEAGEKLEFQSAGASPFNSEFCVSYGSIVAVYYESGNVYEEYNSINEQNWFIVNVCYIAGDLIALCDDSQSILIYDSELSSEKGRIKYKASEVVPLLKHNSTPLLCALDNDKCAFCNYSDCTVSTVIQLDEAIITGYELPQKELIAFVTVHNIYIVSLETFQITDTIWVSNESIKDCGIIPDSDTLCLLLDDNSICFANCGSQAVRELAVEGDASDQTLTNIIPVDDTRLIIMNSDNAMNVIEY